MELGYARVSTVKQDLDRQIDALEGVGIPRDRIYVDRKSGATTDRPGLRAVIAYAREGDVIVVHTLDRLGRTVRDTLNLIHELAERKVGVRNLADPIKVDSSNPEDPMAQLAVVLEALFEHALAVAAQMLHTTNPGAQCEQPVLHRRAPAAFTRSFAERRSSCSPALRRTSGGFRSSPRPRRRRRQVTARSCPRS